MKRSSRAPFATLVGIGVAGALSARFLFRVRPADTDRRLLDWEAVRAAAYRRSGERGPRLDSEQLNERCDLDAHELAPLLAEVCQDAPTQLPQFRAVDRRGFIDQNILIIQRLIEPVEGLRNRIGQSRLTRYGRVATSRYVGELLGFMSHRVLGQYDPVLTLGEADTTAPSLILVQPNLDGYTRKHKVDCDGLRRWIILHELTHAWQFGSHPWLREHFIATMRDALMSDVVDAATNTPSNIAPADLVKRLPASIRAQLGSIAHIQAVMSVLEGYSNYVMNQVGERHLTDFAQLEASFHKRKSDRSLVERLVFAITGINMKMRQYEIGEKFCKAVVNEDGLETLNRVWLAPSMMPTMDELRNPRRWIQRTQST